MQNVIFLALYLILSAVHLYGSAIKNNKIRNYTKPFLMLALLGFYLCSTPAVNWFVVALIMTSWLGDVLLMVHGMKWFTLGGISFLGTHLILIYLYTQNIVWSLQSITVILLYAIIGTGIIRSIYVRLIRYMPKSNAVALLSYLACNISMNLFAALQAVSNLNRGSGLILLGAMLFLASDSLLFLVRFDKKLPFYGQHFNVMLTYTLAKLLIVIGFIFA